MVELALQLLLLAQATVAPQPTAADVLRGAKNAIIGAQSVAYVVTRDYTDSSGNKGKGRTRVLIAKSPFGFRAEHRRDDGSHSETAVSDGKTTRTLTDGKPDQNPTFGPEGPQWSMNIGGNADSDVAATWHLFLDADYFQRAIESGRILYLWDDEVQGEPCSVIVYARDHWTDYFWISTKTGFPRATQRLSMSRGPTRLGARYEMANIHLNPQIQSDAFRLANASSANPPNTISSASAAKMQESSGSASVSHVIGLRLPDLELRDPEFKARLLSDFRGKPTLITFWAPWCSPCREELATLEKIQANSNVSLEIVAIAVQDRRPNVLAFIQNHKEYKFFFFTDADMERETSLLGSFFGIATIGIPITVLTDSQGAIVDSWAGYDGEEVLRQKLAKFAHP
jgi:thiol-disulfide isomerase/thioredoxin